MWENVKNGFRHVGVVSLFGGWLSLVFIGLIYTVGPGERPAIGYLVLTIAVSISGLMAHKWIKALPAIVGFAAMNVIVRAFSDRTSVASQIPPTVSLVLLVCYSTCAVLAYQLGKRSTTSVDKLLLAGFSLSFIVGAADERHTITSALAMFTFLCLAFLRGKHFNIQK